MSGIVILTNPLQPEKVPFLISVRDEILISFKLAQPENAFAPISFTLSDRLSTGKLAQPENAPIPMASTFSKSIPVFMLAQPRNADAPMIFTVLGSFTEVTLLQL